MSAHHRYEVPWAPAPVVDAQGPVAPEHKLHLPHAQTLRSRFLDPLAITLRQTRLQSVPLSITLCVAVLAFLAGTWINTAGSLPTPEGPLVRANHGLVGVVNSSDTCRHPNRSLFEEFLVPCPHPFMSSPTHNHTQVTVAGGSSSRRAMLLSSSSESTAAQQVKRIPVPNPLQPEEFERFSLASTGFDRVRPALQPAASGDAAMHVIPFQTISWYPRITYYPGFVDPQRCQHIIDLASRYLAPSSLAYRPGESIPETQNVRTSSGTFLSREMDSGGVLAWLEERIAAVTHLPVENGEVSTLCCFGQDVRSLFGCCLCAGGNAGLTLPSPLPLVCPGVQRAAVHAHPALRQSLRLLR